MNKFHYLIAGFPVDIETSLGFSPLDMLNGFDVFRQDYSTPDRVAILNFSTCGKLSRMLPEYNYSNSTQALYDFLFDDEDIRCFFYRKGERFLFKMIPSEGQPLFFISSGTKVICNWEENKNPSMLRFALWMAFAIAIAPKEAFPIHSSVVVYNGEANLFLGESGTGKSTHTRLWLKNFPGAKLLNDDSPIIRIIDSKPFVFGSPWSGKTLCFKDEQYPISAIVRLSQAPKNEMEPLTKLSGFGAIYPSSPPAFSHDEKLPDYICQTISSLLTTVPVFHLKCLPDAAAAQLALDTINKSKITKTV